MVDVKDAIIECLNENERRGVRKELPSSSLNTPIKQIDSGLIVHKYILEFIVYPNGKVYTKMFPIGTTLKAMKVKKKGKKVKEMKIQAREEY